MTKAHQILVLYAAYEDLHPARALPGVIAKEVGTTPSYVRTVARQRRGAGESEADFRYRTSSLGRATNRRNCREWSRRLKTADPTKYETRKARHRAWHKERWRADPEFRAKARVRSYRHWRRKRDEQLSAQV